MTQSAGLLNLPNHPPEAEARAPGGTLWGRLCSEARSPRTERGFIPCILTKGTQIDSDFFGRTLTVCWG